LKEHSWIIRSYNDEDEIGYIALMNIVFPRYRCDLKRWRWEFGDNPFGSVQTFSDFKGKIIGHMGLVCVPIKIEKRIILGSQAVDLAVHPSFRREGIFLEIGKKLLRDAKDRGIAISYGVPNDPSYRGHVKYGWFLVSEIPVLVKIMGRKDFLLFVLARFRDCFKRPNLISISKFVRTIQNLMKVASVEYYKHSLCSDFFEKHIVTSFDERFDKLWEEMSSQYQLLVVRNTKYLNWRYVEKPYSNYVIMTVERNSKVEGYIVLLKESHGFLGWKRGYIVDIFAKSEKAIYSLLHYALEYFAKENVNLVTCWMMKNQSTYDCLLQNGFIDDRLSSEKLICSINVDNNKYEKLYHRVKKEWFFTIGDSDIV